MNKESEAATYSVWVNGVPILSGLSDDDVELILYSMCIVVRSETWKGEILSNGDRLAVRRDRYHPERDSLVEASEFQKWFGIRKPEAPCPLGVPPPLASAKSFADAAARQGKLSVLVNGSAVLSSISYWDAFQVGAAIGKFLRFQDSDTWEGVHLENGRFAIRQEGWDPYQDGGWSIEEYQGWFGQPAAAGCQKGRDNVKPEESDRRPDQGNRISEESRRLYVEERLNWAEEWLKRASDILSMMIQECGIFEDEDDPFMLNDSFLLVEGDLSSVKAAIQRARKLCKATSRKVAGPAGATDGSSPKLNGES